MQSNRCNIIHRSVLTILNTAPEIFVHMIAANLDEGEEGRPPAKTVMKMSWVWIDGGRESQKFYGRNKRRTPR